MQKIDKQLRMTFTNYLVSGNNLFSPIMIPDILEFNNISLMREDKQDNK